VFATNLFPVMVFAAISVAVIVLAAILAAVMVDAAISFAVIVPAAILAAVIVEAAISLAVMADAAILVAVTLPVVILDPSTTVEFHDKRYVPDVFISTRKSLLPSTGKVADVANTVGDDSCQYTNLFEVLLLVIVYSFPL